MTAAEARVVLLTNFVPPYRVPVLRALATRLRALEILVSTPMEENRTWKAEWEGLRVTVQRTATVWRTWRHPDGFRERLPLHVPLDTGRRLSAVLPDVVISAEMGVRSLAAMRWARRSGRRVVVWATLSERTERGRGPARRFLRRILLRYADGVIVNGRSGARYVAGYAYPEDRIYTIAQASPLESEAAEEGRPVASLELIYAGQLVERKGLEPFLAVLDRWSRSRGRMVRLRIAGSGPTGRRLSVPAGSPVTLELLGNLPFNELAAQYGASQVLAFPTLADEWGLVVNEAMASGLPVLGSVHSQAVTELVEEGRTGWIFDPEEPGQVEAALDRVVAAGPEGTRRMGVAARERVSELTPEAMATRLAAALDDVLARDRRRP